MHMLCMCVRVCVRTHTWGKERGEGRKEKIKHLMSINYMLSSIKALGVHYLAIMARNKHLCYTYCTYEETKVQRLQWLTPYHTVNKRQNQDLNLVLSEFRSCILPLWHGLSNLFCKGPDSIFLVIWVSVTTTQLYHGSTEAAIANT